ncbi:MAG: hypothetical protein KDB22_04185 [Planctomycetales bacterium]|nr:hypothetical protein [Planctomycetales bacterium]
MLPTLRFDVADATSAASGLNVADATSEFYRLEKLRDSICDVEVKMLSGAITTPNAMQPLGTGFYLLPQQLLESYQADRMGSELARVLSATKQLMSEVDRVLVLGPPCAVLGMRAIMQACCQPYFNELSRGARGSRPRVTFCSNLLDNDTVQGLLQLVNAHRIQPAKDLENRWGLVLIDGEREPALQHFAFRQFVRALQANCGQEVQTLNKRLIVVTELASDLAALAQQWGCRELFYTDPSVGIRFRALSTVGLIPSALLGINIMRLLAGAQAISDHFRLQRASDNIVLKFAAINLWEMKRCGLPGEIHVWDSALDAIIPWFRNLPPRQYQPSDASCSRIDYKNSYRYDMRNLPLVHHVLAEGCRFDPLTWSTGNEPKDPSLQTGSLPALQEHTRNQHMQRMRDHSQPFSSLVMPLVDEFHLGQLMQLLMLAEVVQSRWHGVNPFA